MRVIGTFAVLLAALALVGAGCGGDDEASGDTTTTETTDTETDTGTETIAPGTALKGSVGPGFTISLTTADGTPVETLEAGSYELEIEDLATIHNFRLSGPGVDVSTEVGEEGTQTVPIDLAAGGYTFVCDPHAGQMSGSFQVT